MTDYFLIADIGGTNARFAVYNRVTGNISNMNNYLTTAYDNICDAIKNYIYETGLIIRGGCIAIACPVQDDFVEMTNHSWNFSKSKLKQQLSFDDLYIINDFVAASIAVPYLSQKDYIQIGGNKAIPWGPVAVFGAGTGLGTAYLVHEGGRWISLPGEGGHCDLPVKGQKEIALLTHLSANNRHVSAEDILSGRGLVNLYQTIGEIENIKLPFLTPSDITLKAVNHKCPYCTQALNLFCILLGRFAGNLALSVSAVGGVYIAGGIVPRFLGFLLQSGFRLAFEDKGRFRNFLQKIPVYLIVNNHLGLIGAGQYIKDKSSY